MGFRASASSCGGSDFGESGPYGDLNLRRIVVEREAVPEILLSGLITPQEARDLFDL